MTTIATDGKTMAGDGQGDISDTVVAFTRPKVRRLSDGSLFGLSGNGHDADALAAWLIDGGKPPKLGETMALRLMLNGTLQYINEECRPIEIDLPAAIGSGMHLALGAMEAGASPKQAVEVACRRDPFSGGKITALELKA